MNRSPMPARKTEMSRGKGPSRSAPMERGGEMKRTTTRQRAPRDTGFPAKVKLQIRKRAGFGDAGEARCESCGRWLGQYGGEIQHRVARGSGGSSDPVINGISNGVLLCGSSVTRGTCHFRAERRDPEMMDQGFWILHGKGPRFDPRHVAVVITGPGRIRAKVWLAADGTYATEPPACAA